MSPQVGETVVGESHAWIEWWDGEWVGFDPTNDIAPGDRHIVVARGRDYSDVPPLTGIFSGGSTSSMAVDVQVTRLALTPASGGRAGLPTGGRPPPRWYLLGPQQPEVDPAEARVQRPHGAR